MDTSLTTLCKTIAKKQSVEINLKGISPQEVLTTARSLNPTLTDIVVTVCYRTITLWQTRQKAYKYFLSGARACDGCEANRYYTICGELECGSHIATDEY